MAQVTLPRSVTQHGRLKLHVLTPTQRRLLRMVLEHHKDQRSVSAALFEALSCWRRLAYDPQAGLSGIGTNLRRLQNRLEAARIALGGEERAERRAAVFRAVFATHRLDHIALARDFARRQGIPFSEEEEKILSELSWRPGLPREKVWKLEPVSTRLPGTAAKRGSAAIKASSRTGCVTIKLGQKTQVDLLRDMVERFPQEPSLSRVVFRALREWISIKNGRLLPVASLFAPTSLWALPLEFRAARRALRDVTSEAMRRRVYTEVFLPVWSCYIGCCITQGDSPSAARWGLALADEEERALLSMDVVQPPGAVDERRREELIYAVRRQRLRIDRAVRRMLHSRAAAPFGNGQSDS